MRKPASAVLATVLLGTTAGCADLSGLTALGALPGQAKTALAGVSEDFLHSCERQTLLQKHLLGGATPGVPLNCKPYRELSAALGADQTVLTDYLEALGKLAGNQGYSYGKSASAAEATIAGFSPATGANAELAAETQQAGEAAVTLAGALTGALLHRARERDTRTLILRSDKAVGQLTAALATIASRDYTTVLDNEQAELTAYYQAPLAAPHTDPLVVLLVQRQYDTDNLALERHREAAQEYATVMKDIGALHAKLAAAATKKATFLRVVKSLGPEVSALQEAVLKLQTEVS